MRRDSRKQLGSPILETGRVEGPATTGSVALRVRPDGAMASKAKIIGSTEPKQPETAVEEREGYRTQRVSKK